MKQIRRHVTYANVMSSLAVFLILGGATAIAATKIGANQLKANSVKTGKIVKEAVTAGKLKKNAVTNAKIAAGAVTTDKIANDAVTGDKVNEATLSTVPSAANANTVSGLSVKKINYRVGPNTPGQTILTFHGLTLTASCSGGNLTGTATTSVANSLIHSGGASLEGPFYVEEDEFDPGTNFDFLDNAVTFSDSIQATLTYAQLNGDVVTVVFQAEEQGFGEEGCSISGHATG